MAIKAFNTVERIREAFSSGRFTLEAWKTYAAGISHSLASKCLDDAAQYDFEKEIVPVLEMAVQSVEKLAELGRAFDAAMDKLEGNLPRLSDDSLEITVILYLGMCNGAGWATELDSRDTVLLGAEKIIELNWCDARSLESLIFHEVGHLWHKAVGSFRFETHSAREKSLLQLYQEGVAMACEHILCGNEESYHQDDGEWLSWCRENERELKREYLERMEAGDSTQDFFGDWNRYRGHSDVGYYLGSKFVSFLREKYTMRGIAGLPCQVLDAEFCSFASGE